MSLSCPNKRLKIWKDLVQKVGENKAYLLWAEYDGNVPDNIFNNEQVEKEILPEKKNLNEFINNEGKMFFKDNVEDTGNTVNTTFDNNKQLLFGSKDIKETFTAKEVLENIIDNSQDLTVEGNNLLEKTFNVLNKVNSRVRVVSQEYLDQHAKGSEGSGVAVMVYNSDLNSIYISENALNVFNSDIIFESFLHEIAHSLSIKALNNPQSFEEKQFAEIVKKGFEQYKNLATIKGNNKSYGFTNEKEFVAEIFANEEFRQEIIELDKGFWQKFKEALRRLFGLTKSLKNEELINSILLLNTIDNFIQNTENNFEGFSKDNYNNSFNNIMFKKIEEVKNIELDTLDKQLQHTIDQAKDRLIQLIKRTKSVKKPKNKKDHENFLKGFENLLKEIEDSENLDKWKSIVSYVTSFSNTVDKLKHSLDRLLYDKETDTFTKDIDSVSMLEAINRYDEYLSAYDLLDEIKDLIKRSQNDVLVTKDNKESISEIRSILTNLQNNHEDITSHFTNVRRAYAIKEFSKPENNTKVVAEWRNKLFAEHAKLKNPKETKEEYFGKMINGKYKKDYEDALLQSARKIVYDPYFDISSFERASTDLLNINSPLINLMSNIIGKMRDKILEAYRDKQFEMNKLFKEYSKKYGQNKQSKMYEKILDYSETDDTYYLKGEYSIEYKKSFDKLKPTIQAKKELINSKLEEGLTKSQIKKLPKYIELNKIIKKWFNENTIKVDKVTLPHPKYKNPELSGIEKEVLDYFKSETDKNDEEVYHGQASLVRNIYGAKFYKLPAVTKTDLERTLEGDIKGQLKDKWTDLTETKVDDVTYGEAVDSKNKERRGVKIGYRGNIKSKDQSLDLFTIYKKEALNAINYSEKRTNEAKLKLFVDIAKDKDYKKRSTRTGKWLQNKYAPNSPGVIFKGEFSQELKKIEGLLETHLYDVLSYSGGKVLGTNIEANKLSSMVNGFAASIAMTANIGSAAVNVLNGTTQLIIDAVGNNLFNKSDLLKAEANYNNPKNLMSILADLNQPVKTSFHNQMLDMFDVFGGFDNATQEFIRNSFAKKLISKQSMNGLNEMGEHMMNTVLTEAVLRGIKVMNSQRQYIDKQGNIVEESKAASLFDMLYLDKDGKLKMDSKVIYTKKNLDVEYHKGGKQHINYVIKKKGHDLFGVYDSLMKAEIAKNWWGKTLLMFKNFFLSALKYRYKGVHSSLKSKEDLTEDEITFNNAEQEFTEGIYTTFIRFISQAVIPSLKGLQLAYMKDYYSSLTDYEKANLRKTTLEIGLTMVILPVLGMLLGAAAGDDDDEIYFALYVFRRLESELSQFRDPRELNRMIQNPVAANRFIQNSLTAISDIITPLNFAPQDNEYFFDYLSEDKKGNNITLKHLKKVTPFYAQFDKQYNKLYNLIDK